jgi:hypothetical protein
MKTYQRFLLLIAAAATVGAVVRTRQRNRAAQVAHDVDYVMEIRSWEDAGGVDATTHRARVGR